MRIFFLLMGMVSYTKEILILDRLIIDINLIMYQSRIYQINNFQKK